MSYSPANRTRMQIRVHNFLDKCATYANNFLWGLLFTIIVFLTIGSLIFAVSITIQGHWFIGPILLCSLLFPTLAIYSGWEWQEWAQRKEKQERHRYWLTTWRERSTKKA